MKFNDTSILVTGGNGAIGCNLVKKLLLSNAKVTVLDNFSQSTKSNLPINKYLKIIEGDITNKKDLQRVFSTKFDYVFHLAARFANELSVKNPIDDMRVNIQGTLLVLLEVAKQNPKRFVYTSSSSIYGEQKLSKLSEKTLPYPSTPYAVSKLTGEYYCDAIHKLYNLDYNIVRLSNSYGPFDPPGKYRNVIPNFINSAIHGKSIEITGTGHETRDFTYVEDCVDGIILSAISKTKNEIFNLGTGKSTQIKQIAELVIKYTNSKSKIVYRKPRSFDRIKKRKMNITKAKKLLGYEPKINIQRGLEKTCNWFLNR